MLLMHKLIAISGVKLTDSQQNMLFAPIITKYCQLFAEVQSLAFDLAPFFTYIYESKVVNNTEEVKYEQSDLVLAVETNVE